MSGRTCVGCKARDDRSMLLRVALLGGDDEDADHPSASVVVPDERCRMPGRGAWLHRSGECLDKALRRRAIQRALRLTGAVDARPVEEWFARQLNDKAVSQ